jgi:hypothetical protein
MTTLTMRMIKGHFVVSGPDVEPMKFKTRPEAREWCRTHHPGSPITEIWRGGKARPRTRCRKEAWEGALEPMQDRLFYVRQHAHADGSFEWYVLNGHTQRRASRIFKTRAEAEARRAKLQTVHDAAKVRVISRDDT